MLRNRKMNDAGEAAIAPQGARRRLKTTLKVTLRRQAPAERQDFEAALRIFLKELVRRNVKGEA